MIHEIQTESRTLDVLPKILLDPLKCLYISNNSHKGPGAVNWLHTVRQKRGRYNTCCSYLYRKPVRGETLTSGNMKHLSNRRLSRTNVKCFNSERLSRITSCSSGADTPLLPLVYNTVTCGLIRSQSVHQSCVSLDCYFYVVHSSKF